MCSRWRELSLYRKTLLVLLAVLVYLLSLIPVSIGLYWVKTWLDIDLLKYGGWHAFSRCLDVEKDAADRQWKLDAYGVLPAAR